MENSLKYIKQDLERQLSLKVLYQHRLTQLPEGKLAVTHIKGRNYYYVTRNTKRSFLGNEENEDVKLLKTRRFLTESLRRIEVNCKYLAIAAQNYQDIDPFVVNNALPKSYQMKNADDFLLNGEINPDVWEEAPYAKSTKFPEMLIHRTIKGDCVRSKSEAIIANMLYQKGIPYHYEELLTLGANTIVPDFNILVPRSNRFVKLEHGGMIHDSKYRSDFIWKFNLYMENGYEPWKDILFTFDEKDGAIDTLSISWMLDQFCT